MSGHSIRPAVADDAEGLAAVLKALVLAGQRSKPSDAAFALSHYLCHPQQIRCSVAIDLGGTVLGFQSLKLATAGNPYKVAEGWGIIGTHINPSSARQGIGRALFRSTLRAAQEVGLPAIDATIGETNVGGLSYYGAMGFTEYRRLPGAISKSFTLSDCQSLS